MARLRTTAAEPLPDGGLCQLERRQVGAEINAARPLARGQEGGEQAADGVPLAGQRPEDHARAARRFLKGVQGRHDEPLDARRQEVLLGSAELAVMPARSGLSERRESTKCTASRGDSPAIARPRISSHRSGR